MENSEKIVVTFECPNCHQQKKLRKAPELRTGKMKCPNCQTPIKLIFDTEAQPQTATASILQTANNPAESKPDSKKKTVYGAQQPIAPPAFHNPDSPQTRQDKGHTSYFNPEQEQNMPQNSGKSKTVMAGDLKNQQPPLQHPLYLNRLGRRNKIIEKYRIYEGAITIGRQDPIETSDIMFENDPEMSRRSVKLSVLPTWQGTVIRLKVLKATNPVAVANRALVNGEEVAVNINDVIRLGRTILTITTD